MIVYFQAPGIVKYKTDQSKAVEKRKWLQELGMDNFRTLVKKQDS